MIQTLAGFVLCIICVALFDGDSAQGIIGGLVPCVLALCAFAIGYALRVLEGE